jgi:hypothetical protein
VGNPTREVSFKKRKVTHHHGCCWFTLDAKNNSIVMVGEAKKCIISSIAIAISCRDSHSP